MITWLLVALVSFVGLLFFRKYKAKSDALNSVYTQQAIAQQEQASINRKEEQEIALNKTLNDAEVRSKVDMLKQLMNGVTNAEERENIVSLMLGIKTKEDYMLVYNAFGTFRRRNLLEALDYNLKKEQYQEVFDYINRLTNE